MRRINHIMIDPGHGGRDPGAVAADGTTEAELVTWAGLWLRDLLGARGFSVTQTREQLVEFVELSERCDLANDEGVELFISLHCNAAEATRAKGFEVFTSPGYTDADDVATEIFRCMRRALPTRRARLDQSDGDPDKEARFKVLVGTSMPAVLIELGFLSNPDEAAMLQQPGFISRAVRAIADGIEEWAAVPVVLEDVHGNHRPLSGLVTPSTDVSRY